MKKISAFLLSAICAIPVFANESTLTVDVSQPTGKVSSTLYGLMTEELNHAYDGGLYAELVQNRAFLDNTNTPVHWSVVQTGGANASIALDPAQPLNDKLPTSLCLNVSAADKNQVAGLANDGFWGIPVQPQTTYHASFFAKAEADFSGAVTVAIQSDDGSVVYAKNEIRRLSSQWQQYQVTLKTGKVPPTSHARFILTVDRPGKIWFSLVSLFPPTWKNQPNGFRRDIMQLLVDMHPKFLRFPGGNYVEGDTIATRFQWKQTIGPLSQRPGHPGTWGYRSSDGMGLLEFLNWCADMKAQPVLAVFAGYALNGTHVNPGSELQPYVQEALDEIEYVTGPVTSKWGAERARDGHPQPFDLTYVEIGNEDWFDKSYSYDARFTQFYDAIKSKYPQLQIISTAGFEQSEKLWVHSRQPDLVDEHYYRGADHFIKDAPDHYEKYDRHGPKIFVGEWAAYETSFPPWDKRSAAEPPTPDMQAALGDAAWMLDLERNSDYVVMQCYAPLFVNVNPGGRVWRPNLIGFDALHSFGSPSYYAIQMFSQNTGDEILPATMTHSPVQFSATQNTHSGETIIKLVNPTGEMQKVTVQLKGIRAVASKAKVITLSAAPDDSNSINEPTKIIPVLSQIADIKPVFNYSLPPHAITIVIVKDN